MPLRIAGAGCALMDRLFTGIDFSSSAFGRYRSHKDGDGGLTPGRLVFVTDAEGFSGIPFSAMLAEIVPGSVATTENIGGPSIVAMIHAAQMLDPSGYSVSFHGLRGDDDTGLRLMALLSRVMNGIPLDCAHYGCGTGTTPTTVVFSDPHWDGGHGERCFVNDIGAAASFSGKDLDSSFFDADIAVFGGTGLVPALHDDLALLLPELRRAGRLTVVNTVFDFRNERRDPVGAWPLGKPGESAISLAATDLLMMDRDEALRISGTTSLERACAFFTGCGVGAFAISQGSDDVVLWAAGDRDAQADGRLPGSRSGRRFAPCPLARMPVSERARRQAGATPRYGDTTGCGDAFAGGIIAELARQIVAGKDGELDLRSAAAWGIVGGAATLGIVGGTWYERQPGEKRAVVESFHDEYLEQAKGGLS